MLRRWLGRGREQDSVDQSLAGGDGLGFVDVEDSDGGPADRGAADEGGAGPAKVPVPLVAPGVEEADDLAGAAIDAGDVRPLVTVAKKACEG